MLKSKFRSCRLDYGARLRNAVLCQRQRAAVAKRSYTQTFRDTENSPPRFAHLARAVVVCRRSTPWVGSECMHSKPRQEQTRFAGSVAEFTLASGHYFGARFAFIRLHSRIEVEVG